MQNGPIYKSQYTDIQTMKNKTTAINFDQEADMLYPTLNKVEELLKEYQMVPVFYEVLADYMTPIHIGRAHV